MLKSKIVYLLLALLICADLFSQNKRGTPDVVMNPPPEVHFAWTGACAGDTTCFTNLSLLSDTYTWTIVDPSNPHAAFTSNDTNLCYVFPGPGKYYVSLQAYNNHYVTLYDSIMIGAPTTADFSWIHCTNAFCNRSLCASSFYWDFGDGTTSTLPIPSHQYADTGHYNVTLIAYNGASSDTLRQNIYINPLGYPNTQFTYTVSLDTVHVHATYYDGLTDYYWTFNDAVYNYGTGRDSMHFYNDAVPTMHIITLVTRNGCGFFSGKDTIYTAPLPPPTINFSWTGTCSGDTTCFTNQSFLAHTYTWTATNVGSTTPFLTLNDTNFCYAFATGKYVVTLTGYNGQTSSLTDTVTIGNNTTADFSWTPCTNAFVNRSSCATSFQWYFGDGNTSVLSSPVHQYADTGLYHVTLIAINGAQADTIVKSIFVNATTFCTALYTYTVSYDTVFVHASYYDRVTSYHWNFHDVIHSSASGRDTMHVYSDTVATMHIIDLSAQNACGTALRSDTVYTDPLGIKKLPTQLSFTSNLTVVPNPSQNGVVQAYYSAYQDAQYVAAIYNVLGEKVFDALFYFKAGLNGFTISTDGLSQGTYILVLSSENSYTRRKFLVEKH